MHEYVNQVQKFKSTSTTMQMKKSKNHAQQQNSLVMSTRINTNLQKQPVLPFDHIKMNIPIVLQKNKEQPIQMFPNVFDNMGRNDEKPYLTSPNFTLHHLVSFEKIKTMFSAFAANDSLQDFWTTITRIMTYYNAATDMNHGINAFAANMLAIINQQNPAFPQPDTVALITPQHWEEILRLITWYPPNLVEGPDGTIRKPNRIGNAPLNPNGDPGILYDTEAAISSLINNAPAHIQTIDALTAASPAADAALVSSIYLNQTPGGAVPVPPVLAPQALPHPSPGVHQPQQLIQTIDILQNIVLPPESAQYLDAHIAMIPQHPQDIDFIIRQNIIHALNNLPFAQFDAYILQMNPLNPPALPALTARVNLIRANRNASILALNGLALRQAPQQPAAQQIYLGDLFI